jgi:hypothetical protein
VKVPYRREKTREDKVAMVLWLLARHSERLHSCAAHPRPLTSPHHRAGTYPLVDYELLHRRNTTCLRENFDPRARWRNAISAARVLSRFGNHKGANKHKDKTVVSSDNEDDDGGGGSTSQRATPKTDNNSCRRCHRTIAYYRAAGWQDS